MARAQILSFILAFAFACGNFVNVVTAENNLGQNQDPYRLPTSVYPKHYLLTLHLGENFGPNQNFTGYVFITLNVTSPVNVITLHSKFLNYTAQNVRLTCGTNTTTNLVQDVTFDEGYEMVYVNATNTIQPGECSVVFTDFVGQLRDDMFGFYRSYYTDENSTLV